MRPKESLIEIKKYIDDIRIDSSSVRPNDALSRELYRKFHALLIAEHLIDNNKHSASLRLYTQESVADVSTAYFLSLIGVYKAGLISLRSGIENSFRVQAASGGADVSLLMTVPALVEVAKSVAQTSHQRKRISTLYGIYGELCQSVHSVSVNYMALRIPFERIIEYDEKIVGRNFDFLLKAVQIITEVYFIEFHKYIADLDFRNADLLRDAIEASVKAEALNSTF